MNKNKSKIVTIGHFRKKYKYDTLIETGIYKGDNIEREKGNFKKIISIELGKNLYDNAVKRFANDKNVELYHGDSGNILPGIVEGLKKPVIFFLDGHFSGGVTVMAEIETPIRAELDTIMKSPYRHVILIDDARCFDGTHDYPTVEQVKEIVKTKYKVTVEHDIIRCEPI